VLKSNRLRVYDSIADLIPNPDDPTPLVRLSERFNPHSDFKLFLKLEGGNPFGSIKDRVALSMLQGTKIDQGQILIEPSSGNTGLALAALANAKGLPVEIAVPEGVPEEKKVLLRLLGVKLWETPDDLCPLFPSEGARGLVKGIVESPIYRGRYVTPNQYENELNVAAHYTTTGPEIWQQTQGAVDHFLAGFGTCGTITGVGGFLKERNPDVRVIGVEPASNEHHLPGMKRISDLPEDLVPKILNRSLIDDSIEVEDDLAYETGIRLARTDGILVGPTTGAILAAAIEYGENHSGTVVVISPDSALKYVSSYARYLKRGVSEDSSDRPAHKSAR
jgi:cysteine synthase A/cysteine synthase B